MKEELRVELAHPDRLSEDEIRRLYEIMIHGYAVTEAEVWGPNYTRMPFNEFLETISKGELYVARLNDLVVGSIQVRPLSDDTYVFGLLSADFDQSGKGIGRALIQTAEDHARKAGAKKMQLEILRPLDMDIPFKDVLKQWYEGMGYRLENSMSFIERKPHRQEKAKKLIRPSIFDCYLKDL